MTVKTCTGPCGLVKTDADFYAGKNHCKDCVKAAVKARREANLDQVRAYDRERSKSRDHTATQARYRERNRDTINAKKRAARAADPEAARAKDRAYYLSNKDGFAAASRRWKKSNSERMALYDARRRARKAGAFLGKVSYDLVRASATSCYLCGQELSGDIHLDHIVPLAKGGAHCNDNLAPTHATCNLRKHDLLLAELTWYKGPLDLGVSLHPEGRG